MIKNESKIIERCIDNCINYVDAVNILDTGSTDNTIELCNSILLKNFFFETMFIVSFH